MLRKIKHLERVLRCKSTLVIISFVFFVLLAIYGFVKKEPAFRYKKKTFFVSKPPPCDTKNHFFVSKPPLSIQNKIGLRMR
jgi:hypothetical protein